MATVSDYTALLSGRYWNGLKPSKQPAILTYSFVTSSAAGNSEPNKIPFISPLNAERKTIVKSALEAWASISGIILIETDMHEGDLNFGFYDLTNRQLDVGFIPAGDAGYPANGILLGGDGRLNVYGGSGETNGGVIRFHKTQQTSTPEQFKYVALHEIGHALGLKHPFDGDINLTPTADSAINTVMSYNGQSTKLGPLDIDAIQAIYGNSNSDSNYGHLWYWNSTTETLTQITNAGDDYVKGTRANDVVTLGGGRDAVVTYAGDDIIYASALSYSNMNLGSGVDVVVYDMKSNDVVIVPSENANYISIRNSGVFEGWETVINVEIVKFNDKSFYYNNYLPFDWKSDISNVRLVAATYQFFTGRIPTPDGFEYLISSPFNGADLHDKYYSSFNIENRYINFAANLGLSGEGKLLFDEEYGKLSFADAVRKAYISLSGNASPPAEALAFLESAKGYYESVAVARVASSLTTLANATKIVAIGSIANEIVKSGIGFYPEEIDKFINEIQLTGVSPDFGNSIFT